MQQSPGQLPTRTKLAQVMQRFLEMALRARIVALLLQRMPQMEQRPSQPPRLLHAPKNSDGLFQADTSFIVPFEPQQIAPAHIQPPGDLLLVIEGRKNGVGLLLRLETGFN